MATTTPKVRGRPRREGLAQQRREQILSAATRLFARDGYDRTDLQLVADDLGVGKGTVYRYFPTKEDLFLAAVDRAMKQLHAAINAAVENQHEPLEQVAAAVHAYLAFFEEHPDFVELLIQERAAFRRRTRPTYFEHREASIGRWHALYGELILQGRIRAMPVERIADTIGNLVYGAMFTNYFTGGTKSASDQAKDILDIFFRGILAEGSAQSRAQGPEAGV